MNENVGPNKSSGKFVKIVLTLAFLVFIGLGAFAIYRYLNNETVPGFITKITPTISVNKDVQIFPTVQSPQTTPTVPVLLITITPALVITPSVTPQPTKVPTKTFTPTPTIVPTMAITITPTITKSPTSTPTKTPEANLPISGDSTPTLYLLLLGIILLLPALLLL